MYTAFHNVTFVYVPERVLTQWKDNEYLHILLLKYIAEMYSKFNVCRTNMLDSLGMWFFEGSCKVP